MPTNEKNRKISAKQYYIEINGEKVPVTEEVYRAYYRPVWAEHKREERSRKCRLPNGTRCNKKCSECTMMKNGSDLSLESLNEEVGFEPQSDYNIADVFEKKELLKRLHTVLDELEEIDCKIVKLKYFEAKSEREIASIVGFKSHKSVSKRLNKALAFLRDKLKDFI